MKPARTTRQQRLYDQVARTRGNCHFDDLARLLEAYDYTRRRQSGSHVIFKREGAAVLFSIPKAKPVKEHYVDVVLETIDRLEREVS